MLGGGHFFVDRPEQFLDVRMPPPEHFQVFRVRWLIAVAAPGVILVEDQVNGEFFQRAKRRIAGNIIGQARPQGKQGRFGCS